MDQHNCEHQEPTDNPIAVPTAFQVSCDHTLYPECTHNPMSIQCNQYPNLNHNLALPQFLVHHNYEDLDPTDTPSAVPALSKLPVMIHTTLSVLITQWKPSAINPSTPP